MKKNKGFSLVEMLIVLSIVLILLLVFQKSFKPKDVEFYYGQKCVNDLYSYINNFISDGLSSKGFYSGSDLIYPDSYTLVIDPSKNKVSKLINGTGLSTANLSGAESSKHFCNIPSSYNIILTGENIQIEIQKGIYNNQFNINRIDGSSGYLITGHTNLLLCKEDNGECFNIGQYLIDKRNQSISKRVCMAFSGTDCRQWNQ